MTRLVDRTWRDGTKACLLPLLALALSSLAPAARAQDPYIFIDLSLPGVIIEHPRGVMPFLRKYDALFNPRSKANIEAQRQWQEALGKPLNDALKRFRRAGFDEPWIEVNNPPGSSDPVYKTYLFPFNILTGLLSGTIFPGSGAYVGCNLFFVRKIMVLNLDKNITDINEYILKAYHELTHAIQANTPLFKRGLLDDACIMPAWVSEGMADGVRNYIGSKTIPNFDFRYDHSAYRGVRSYQLPLHTKKGMPNEINYRTSSFWRYLLEHFGGLPTLAELMQTPMSILDNRNLISPVAWLDEALGAKFGEGMDYFFPAFITEFASYGGSRFESLNGRRIHLYEWLGYVLDGCTMVELEPGETELLTLEDVLFHPAQKYGSPVWEPISAFCVNVHWDASENQRYAEFFEVSTPDVAQLDQIHVGLAYLKSEGKVKFRCHEAMKGRDYLGGQLPPCHLKVFETVQGTGLYSRRWIFDQGKDDLLKYDFHLHGANGDKIYVLSNVAPMGRARHTKPIRDLTIRIGFSKTESESTANLGPPLARPMKGPAVAATRAQELYGVDLARPVFEKGLISSIGFSKFPNEDPHQGETLEANYHVSPDQNRPVVFGQTGPFYGTVTKSERGTDGQIISSDLCAGAKDRPIGTILESTEDRLVVEISTPLCLSVIAEIPSCRPDCPIVETITATMKMPLGRRYYNDTMPIGIVTPGLTRYIERYTRNMSRPFGLPFLGANFPGLGGDGSGPGGSLPGSGGAVSGGASSGGLKMDPDCDCSCEAMSSLSQAQQSQSMDERMQAVRCLSQCTPEFEACPQN